jgi:hypothetical protein
MSYGYIIPENETQARRRIENIVRMLEVDRWIDMADDKYRIEANRRRDKEGLEAELVYLHQWLKDNAN